MDMKFKGTQKERCMVMKMNKSEFLKKFSEVSNYDMDTCKKINEVIEDNSFIGKKNKEKLVGDLIEKLNFSKEEAEKIYETALDIIGKEIKEKIKHPFKDKDKK